MKIIGIDAKDSFIVECNAYELGNLRGEYKVDGKIGDEFPVHEMYNALINFASQRSRIENFRKEIVSGLESVTFLTSIFNDLGKPFPKKKS